MRQNRRTISNNLPADIERVVAGISRKIFAGDDWEKSFGQTVRVLNAVRNMLRHPSLKSKAGRRGAFPRTFLQNAKLQAERIIADEFGGAISLERFIAAYLPVLRFPADIQTALGRGDINIEEARILLKINKDNIPAGIRRHPSAIRTEIVASHAKRGGSQNDLRRRVSDYLKQTPVELTAEVTRATAEIVEISDELVSWSEYDTEHLFWEEIKNLVYALRDVDTNLMEPEEIAEILKAVGSLQLRLKKYSYRDDEV